MRPPWREQILVGSAGGRGGVDTEHDRSNFARAGAGDCLVGHPGARGRGRAADGRCGDDGRADLIDAASFTRHADRAADGRRHRRADRAVRRADAAARRRPAGLHQGDRGAALAVEMLLERDPGYRTSIAFLQVAVPSWDNVREYRQLRAAVEQHRADQRALHRARQRRARALPVLGPVPAAARGEDYARLTRRWSR